MFTVTYSYRTDAYHQCTKRFDSKRDAYNYSKRVLHRAIETHTVLELVIRDSQRSSVRVCEMTNAYYAKPLQTIVAYPDNPFEPVYIQC